MSQRAWPSGFVDAAESLLTAPAYAAGSVAAAELRTDFSMSCSLPMTSLGWSRWMY